MGHVICLYRKGYPSVNKEEQGGVVQQIPYYENPFVRSYTARDLFNDIEQHRSERIEFMLEEHSFSINSRNENDETMVICACRCNNAQALTELLKQEPDLELLDSDGNTALLVAA